MCQLERKKGIGIKAKEVAWAIAEMFGDDTRVLAKLVDGGKAVRIKVLKPDGEGKTTVSNK